jgi:PEP-CTERM motif
MKPLRVITVMVMVLGIFMLLGVSLAEAIPLSEGAAFKVQEGSVKDGQTPSNLLTANALEFSFNSATTQATVPGGFSEQGAASIGGFSLNGTTVPSFLGSPAPQGYAMYATYTATGNSTFVTPNEIEDNYTSFVLHVFIDPNQSVVINTNGTVSGLSGDEYEIASGTLAPAALCPTPTCGQDHVFLPPVLANGDFHILMNFLPSADGKQYFVDPSPFYLFVNFAGVISTIQFPGCTPGTPPVCANFNSTEQGSGDAFFPAPEPSSLLLLGAGLLVVSARMCRRRQAA